MIVSPPDSEVAALFGAGELVMWPALPFTHVAALAALPIHGYQKWKKLKSRDALVPVKDLSSHPLSVWTHDPVQACAIQAMLRDTEDEVRACMRRWFPDARLGTEMHSWRYMPTGPEPLHFDVYADRVQRRVVRLFVNLDTVPRVWDVGPLARGLDDGVWDPVYKARVITAPVERIEFAPGAAWLVESRRVAHAIIYGRRAAMFSFEES